MEALQVGAGVDEPREVEVIGRDQVQRVDVLPHVRDVGRVLGQRHVELAGDAVCQGHVLRVRKHVTQVRHHLVNAHLKYQTKCSKFNLF